MSPSILWRDVTTGALDRCTLSVDDSGTKLSGTVLLAHEGAATEVRYTVMCDASGNTRSVGMHVHGAGSDERRLALLADGEGGWSVSREPVAELAGCADVDLAVTPATNSLVIRRLQLGVGESAELLVAYVRFPDLGLERADQRYERLGPSEWRFRCRDFTAELVVDDQGLVTDYGGVWETVAGPS